MPKVIPVIFLFVGETIGIVAEIFSAKSSNNFLRTFLFGFLLITISAVFLILGYMLGFKYFKNIWIVSAISILSILMVEPILDYTVFNQLPTKGAFIGLILGAIGFAATIFIK